MSESTLSGSGGNPQTVVIGQSASNPAPFVTPATVGVVDITTDQPVTLIGAGGVGSGTGSDTVTPQTSNVTIHGGSGDLTFVGGTGDASVEGGSGSVTLFGGAGGGVFKGGAAGDNLLKAGEGPTTLYGGGSNSVLYAGGNVSDVLYAGEGNQTLVGSLSTGNNIFFGGPGNDVIDGGVGNDLFFAGSGAESLLGGGGQNTYEFLASMTSASASVSIGDFQVGQDRLIISGYGTSTDDVYNNKTVSAGSTILTLGDGTKVVLTGITNLDRGSLT